MKQELKIMTKSQDMKKLTAEEREAVDLFARLPKEEQDELFLKTFKVAALGYACEVLREAQKELRNGK